MFTRRGSSVTAPLLALLLSGLGLTTLIPKAAAITDGQLDGTAHTYVAMVVAYYDYVDENGAPQQLPLWRGSWDLSRVQASPRPPCGFTSNPTSEAQDIRSRAVTPERQWRIRAGMAI